MKFLIILPMLFLLGCASTPTQSTNDALAAAQKGAVYKYDMSGTVNGTQFTGVGVIPYADKYSMQFVSPVNVDLLSIASCHRDWTAESVATIGWFRSKVGYSYQYDPSLGIENTGSCLVRIGAYNRDKGQNVWGIIDFENPGRTLPATSFCNGNMQKFNGVSICQSKVGLIQRIVFDSPVMQDVKALDSKCVMSSKDQKVWEYQLPVGECVIEFKETIPPYRLHRHTTVAYTDVIIRGNQ